MGVRASLGSSAPAVPGELAQCVVAVENTGALPTEVRLSLLGEPAAWGWITPATLLLASGQHAEARLTLKLPRAPHPPAGPLAITVRLTAGTTSQDAHGTIEVAPFADVFATLAPHITRGGRGGRQLLAIENRGNTRLAATVETEGDDVSVSVDPDRIELAPGGSTEAQVTAHAGHAPFRGATTNRPFAVVVRPAGAGRPGRAEGVVELAPAGWTGRIALLLLVLAIAGVGLGALFSPSGDKAEPPITPESAASVPGDCNARAHLSPDANGIVRPGAPPLFDYSFLFVVKQGCQPVRFNPCQPVRYALNRALASDADVADLTEAMRKLSVATGLEFERVADTPEDPRTTPRPRRQPDGTFVWAPVVIGWSHLAAGDSLRARSDQRANPDVVVGGGGRPEVVDDVIVTGNLILNLDAVTDTDTRAPVPHGFGTGVNWGRIMMHELAHVIGLGHVESRTSIMNEELTAQTISSAQWGVGDLIGLRQLGRDGGCLTVPPVPLQGAPR